MKDPVSTVSALAAGLSERERALLLQALAPARPRVALVGLGCRFPGGDGPEGFWELLARGGDAVRQVPADRWDIDAYFDPDPDRPGRMITRHGAFLDRVDAFDAAFFEVSPHEARRMDPQQRLLLEVAWDALEHAGLPADALRGSNTGVFVGACSHDYDDLQPTPSDAHTLTGGLLSVLSGRLAYTLGLQGPTLTVDTACSSSLAALHLAARSLRSGECDLAIAAGVNLVLAPEGSVRLSRMRALAPDGRCRTFDARAAGYARGEGVGVVVLKREADARRDRDRIWAILRGSAVNHDGRSTSLTAPNGLSQRDVILRALADADLTADAVDHIEAHGTGTPLGDPIEVETLRELFGRPGRAAPCVIASVKTNIGHLEAGAGIAGVLKATLALAHETIPQHLHFTQPNPRLDLGDALLVPTAPRPWPRGPRERVAGVSSFGISGTNAHVLLSEGPPAPAPDGDLAGDLVLPLSARSPAALAQLARAWLGLLHDPAAPPLAALVRAAATRRSHHAHRLAVVGATREALARALAAELANPDLRAPKHAEPAPATPLLADPHALARRYTRGETIAWAQVYPGAHPPVALPRYPWQRTRHWFTDPARGAAPVLSPETASAPPSDLSPETASAPPSDLSPETSTAPPSDLSPETSTAPPSDLSPETASAATSDLSPETSTAATSDLSPETSTAPPSDLSPAPAAAPPPPAFTGDRAALDGLVLTAVRVVLGFEPGLTIPPHQDLRDLGMDSLLALDLAAELTRTMGLPVPNSFPWDYPSVAAMGDALALMLHLEARR